MKYIVILSCALISCPTVLHANSSLFKGAAYSSLESIKSAGDKNFSSSLRSVNIKSIASNSGIPAITTTVKADNDYYEGNLTGKELFFHLHKIISVNKVKSYSEAKSYMYSTADNTVYNGQRGIKTFYSQIFVQGTSGNGGDYPERSDLNKDGVVDKIINAEHIWPQSFFGKQAPMVSDLHHLKPTFATPNNRRSHYPFSTVSSPRYQTSAGSKGGSGSYEPCDPSKGDVARSMLYFLVRYHNRNIRSGNFNAHNFVNSKIEMFLQWNRMDPPDEDEKRRNELIYQFQGNRNPFIDDYTLADKVGAAAFKM